jgi:hypothetical protein
MDEQKRGDAIAGLAGNERTYSQARWSKERTYSQAYPGEQPLNVRT